MIHAIDTFLLLQTGRLLVSLKKHWKFSNWKFAEGVLLAGLILYTLAGILICATVPAAFPVVVVLVIFMGLVTAIMMSRVNTAKTSWKNKETLERNRETLGYARLRPMVILVLMIGTYVSFCFQNPEHALEPVVIIPIAATNILLLSYSLGCYVSSVELESEEYDDAVMRK